MRQRAPRWRSLRWRRDASAEVRRCLRPRVPLRCGGIDGRTELLNRLSEAYRTGTGHRTPQIAERDTEVLRHVKRRDELALIPEAVRRPGQCHSRREQALDARRLLRMRADLRRN